MSDLPEFTHEDVLSAIELYNQNGMPAGFRQSYTYDLLYNGCRYPPPAIAALAAERMAGSLPPPAGLRCGAKTACFRLLRQAGFRVIPKPGVIPFERGHNYPRADLAHYLGTKEDTSKGDWATGHHFYHDLEADLEGWWFLFPNVGSAGRTGHDYPNEWLNDGNLRWFGKAPSRLGQPHVTSLLGGNYPVLLFTREQDRAPFTYQGQVKTVSVTAGPPIEVVWKITKPEARTLAPDEAPEAGPAGPAAAGRSTRSASRGRQFWAFLANPKRYDIEGAVGALDEDLWMVPEGDVHCGDRATIWKAKGNDEHRGVVALAEVLSEPAIMNELERHPDFWRSERPPATRRVRLRYVRPAGVPVWFDGRSPSELDALTVSRGQGSGPYYVQPKQWAALLALVGGWTDAPEAEEVTQRGLAAVVDGEILRRRGQGFSPDPEFRRAVEQRGMAVAMEHYSKWDVKKTSENRPYDLQATLGGQTRYIEVKGTTGGPDFVSVTYNEVEHARAHPEESVLIIVYGVEVGRDTNGMLVGRGGQKLVVEPWRPTADDLKAIAYRYKVPNC